MYAIDTVKKIMTEFADSTGLSGVQTSPRRYLWTDAFAVCSFIELYRQTKAEDWQRLALLLVEMRDLHGRKNVDKTGKVVDINILRGLDPVLDNEVIKVLEDSPKWKPA